MNAPTVQETVQLSVPVAGGAMEYLDNNYPGRAGWKEIVISAGDGAAIGATVYLRPGLSAEERWALEAHELTHVAQVRDRASVMGDEPDVAPPDSAVEQEAELVGQQLAAFTPLTRPLAASAPAGRATG